MGARLRFEVTRVLAVSNDEVWRVLADFGTEHRWSKTLVHCERDTPDVHVGTARSCRLPRALMGRTQVREVLTELQPGRLLAYRLEGPAGPFASAASRWSTSGGGNATAVTVEGYFEPKNWAVRAIVWPLVRPFLRRLTQRVLGELEVFVAATCTRARLV
ncbi:MAG TPA: SRPBCC family protein [Polyangia bacterium]|nr:SRPBCC family protein [Polyangia bacterium]